MSVFEKAFTPEVSPEGDSRCETAGTAVNYFNAVIFAVDRAVIDEGLQDGDIYATAVAKAKNYAQQQQYAADVLGAAGMRTTEFNPAMATQQLTADRPAPFIEPPAFEVSPQLAASRQIVSDAFGDIERAAEDAANGQPYLQTHPAWTAPSATTDREPTNA